MLFRNQSFHWLRVVNPLKGSQSVGDGHHFEGLDVKVSVLTAWVLLENSIYDAEELLDSLVETKILSSLDQEMVVLLIARMNRYFLWPSYGS